MIYPFVYRIIWIPLIDVLILNAKVFYDLLHLNLKPYQTLRKNNSKIEIQKIRYSFIDIFLSLIINIFFADFLIRNLKIFFLNASLSLYFFAYFWCIDKSLIFFSFVFFHRSLFWLTSRTHKVCRLLWFISITTFAISLFASLFITITCC